MKELSRTKIIATIGPASASKKVLIEMINSGVTVCRLNFSHGKYEEHLAVIELVREVNREINSNVALLADLQGPKIRFGEVENNAVELIDGKEIEIVTQKCIGTANQVYLTYENFPKDVEPGDEVLVDDGKIKLRVVDTNRTDKVKAIVIHGGILSSKKGVNLPNTKISMPSLTEKDLADLDFALEHNVDWVALSFVRTVTDIVNLKEIIRHKKKHALVVAKIEKPEAIAELDNIIDMTDAIMVARGDLGVEVPFDKVPLIQKEIVKKCIEYSKPVIIATQMLESMITNFRPTRAEATDVANAVMDGSDTLMLSAETSVGKYPIETIKSMESIIKWTEDNGFRFNREHAPKAFSHTFLADSICYNACKMARQVEAKAIVTFSYSGYTAFRIASQRPNAKIYVFTGNKDLLTKMSLVWGVKAFYFDKYDNIDESIAYSIKYLLENKYVTQGDFIVHVASTPLHEKGKTNMIKLSCV